MRNQFINSLMELRSKHEDVYLLVADLGYSVVEPFQASYAQSFINVGVAEQNMAGIAAGIASENALVFCYSIANFPTFRCAEQIRNDIDYHNLSVCIVSVGGGVAYGNMGYSHHAVQDISLLRSFPNMLIFAPCDPLECKLAMNLIAETRQPSYLRLHKQGEPQISQSLSPLVPGEPRFLGGSSTADMAILTTGYAAQGIFQRYANSNKYGLYTLPAWGMKSRSFLPAWADKFSRIYVVEDHLLDGGFCSWILESLMGTSSITKIISRSISQDLIGFVASESTIHSYAGLYNIP
jgi:transketolase